MSENIELSTFLPVTPHQVYSAWLDSAAHGAFTGSPAVIDASPEGTFTAWDGYISGRTQLLEPDHLIVQSWRTTEFPESATDSRLEVRFETVPGGTRLTLRHTEIPTGQGEMYRQGWLDYYFTPMLEYFSPRE
jgi:activator of HSP90 ATPase